MSSLLNWVRSYRAQPQPSTVPIDPFSLHGLPTELVLEIVGKMDKQSLHALAGASKLYFKLATDRLLELNEVQIASRTVFITEPAALCALRLSLALEKTRPYGVKGPMDGFEFYTRDGFTNVDVNNLYRLRGIFERIRGDMPEDVYLTFDDNILRDPQMSREIPNLLQSLCGLATIAVVLAEAQLWTYRANALRSWSPPTSGRQMSVRMHDGTTQTVLAVQSIVSIHARQLIGNPPRPNGVSEGGPCTLIVIDEWQFTALVLSVELPQYFWKNILMDTRLVLPELLIFGVWSKEITPEMFFAFLTRHEKVWKAAFMVLPRSKNVEPISSVPRLPSLTKLSGFHYFIRALFAGLTNTTECFPSLNHLELCPADDASISSQDHLYLAVREAAKHAGWTTLTIHAIGESDIHSGSSWPVFPVVDQVTFNTVAVEVLLHPTRLARLIAQSFPALGRLTIDDGFTEEAARKHGDILDSSKSVEESLSDWEISVARTIADEQRTRSEVAAVSFHISYASGFGESIYVWRRLADICANPSESRQPARTFSSKLERILDAALFQQVNERY
ncbi:hypothetical protein MKEN_01331100 [Mycena kentingensis (nom. inval.)]|nr:hypothetical protein MKEN_01331100 [Mycena kentingensis (nom. inval.)]